MHARIASTLTLLMALLIGGGAWWKY